VKIVFNFSKGFYLIFIAIFLVMEFKSIGAIKESFMKEFIFVFYGISVFLILISVLTCFAPIKLHYDLSIIFPELRPLKKNFFSTKKMKRFLLILEQISLISIYLSVLFYVSYPSISSLNLLTYSFLPSVVYNFIKAFVPSEVVQDLADVFPELKV
jgi:hypothetical protein